MARIRTIKPDFFRHEELYLLEKETGLPLRVAFPGLWCVADREGRFKWRPKYIKMDVLPYDDVDMETVLGVLWENGFIRKYEVEGVWYGCIPSFGEHQVINNREAKSKIPPESLGMVIRKDASFTRHGNYQGEGREGKGKEGNTQMQPVCKALADIFGREWVSSPQDRLPGLASWYKEIEYQAARLVEVYGVQDAVRQIVAYVKHCKLKDRKLIGTVFKSADTILSADWITLAAPDQPPRASPYEDAEYNRKQWTDEAWRSTYARQIATDEGFRKHFQITQ